MSDIPDLVRRYFGLAPQPDDARITCSFSRRHLTCACYVGSGEPFVRD
jgi:hypothetical protein